MKNLYLLDRADLSIYFDADMTQYADDPVTRPNITRQQFIDYYENALSRGFARDGVEFGGVLFHDKQIHFAVLPEYQGKWAFLLEPVLKWLFTLQEVTDVTVERSNQKSVSLWDRAGILRLHEDEKSITFRFCDHSNLFYKKRFKHVVLNTA